MSSCASYIVFFALKDNFYTVSTNAKDIQFDTYCVVGWGGMVEIETQITTLAVPLQCTAGRDQNSKIAFLAIRLSHKKQFLA